MATMAIIHHGTSRTIMVLIGGPTGGIVRVSPVTGTIIAIAIRRVAQGIVVTVTTKMKRTRYTLVQGIVISAETTVRQWGAMSRLLHPVIPVMRVWS